MEYFVSILVAGAYLAKLTEAIGLSDGVTGVLTSFVSLGCGFQIFALFLMHRRPVKRWVTPLHIVNQLCFAFLYAVPLFHVRKTVKAAVFIVLLLLGNSINNVVNSPKINWFMELVDDRKRGVFTANKEIVSLFGGMLFSFAMGAVIDAFEDAGRINVAFAVGAVTLFALMVLHTLTLVLSKEKRAPEDESREPIGRSIKGLLKNKTVFKVILLTVLWNVAMYATTPFYGSYQNKELGFSMTFISVLAAVYAVVRAAFSRLFGRYADKHSFICMLNICYCIAFVAFFVNMFTVPKNGKVLFTLYYALYAMGMAGINSGAINLIYDEVEHGKRTGAYALQQSIAGIAGFATSTLVSFLVRYIQHNGNRFLGMHLYAQQAVSAIGVITVAVILLYLNLALRKKKGKKEKSE